MVGTERAAGSIGAIANVDIASVEHFGHEWAVFDQQTGWSDAGTFRRVFEAYFAPLPAGSFNMDAVVADFGAGSGRWARLVAPQVGRLYVVEPSSAAMGVARAQLSGCDNAIFVEEPIGGPSVPQGALDVAYSLGVIHHVPDPIRALRDVRAALKPGGVFVGYLYYALDNRPGWYRAMWRASDRVRAVVSGLPERPKRRITDIGAALIYWPLARTARLLGRFGASATLVPLSQYADKSFYVMRNDALDRFGTPLEQRFTRTQISGMLDAAGFDTISLVFSDREPFWCFSVRNGGAAGTSGVSAG